MTSMPSQGISLDGANEAKMHSGAILMSFASSQPTKGPAGRGEINQRFLKKRGLTGYRLTVPVFVSFYPVRNSPQARRRSQRENVLRTPSLCVRQHRKPP